MTATVRRSSPFRNREHAIESPNRIDDSVVIHPDHDDGRETNEVSRIRRPFLQQGGAEAAGHLRVDQVEDEHRRGHREDSIAECFGPGLFHADNDMPAGIRFRIS
jgi:hypothetical protein